MNGEATIHVVVANDHDLVRSSLISMMEAFDDLTVVGEAADGEGTIRLCETCEVDVILMDLVMPGMDGITATSYIRSTFPQVQIIVLTVNIQNLSDRSGSKIRETLGMN